MQKHLFRQNLMSQIRRSLCSLYQVSIHPGSVMYYSNRTLGFQGLKICSTGFVRIDLLHLSKLVNLVGE